MFSLGLKNFRSLENTGLLPVRPITLLIGQNSSGKSTFTRTFPMLKQSVQRRSSAPVLWYGEYVDFGSLAEIRSKFAPDGDVCICFQLDHPRLRTTPRMPSGEGGFVYYGPERNYGIETLKYEIRLIEQDGHTRLQSFRIELNSDYAEISIDPVGIIQRFIVNKRAYENSSWIKKLIVTNNELVPQLVPALVGEELPAGIAARTRTSVPLYEFFDGFIAQRLHRNASSATRRRISSAVFYSSNENIKNRLKSLNITMETWKKYLTDLDGNGKALLDLRTAILIRDLPDYCKPWALRYRECFRRYPM